jgi:hypothetical protein
MVRQPLQGRFRVARQARLRIDLRARSAVSKVKKGREYLEKDRRAACFNST